MFDNLKVQGPFPDPFLGPCPFGCRTPSRIGRRRRSGARARGVRQLDTCCRRLGVIGVERNRDCSNLHLVCLTSLPVKGADQTYLGYSTPAENSAPSRRLCCSALALWASNVLTDIQSVLCFLAVCRTTEQALATSAAMARCRCRILAALLAWLALLRLHLFLCLANLIAACQGRNAKRRADNRYLSGNFAPVNIELHEQGLPVEGSLPRALDGVFIR